MIDFGDIKKLGFKKAESKDDVYENQYGRPYWWMEFFATIQIKGATNEITFNWDCNTRVVSVFKNDTKKIGVFEEYEEFIKFFSIFQ